VTKSPDNHRRRRAVIVWGLSSSILIIFIEPTVAIFLFALRAGPRGDSRLSGLIATGAPFVERASWWVGLGVYMATILVLALMRRSFLRVLFFVLVGSLLMVLVQLVLDAEQYGNSSDMLHAAEGWFVFAAFVWGSPFVSVALPLALSFLGPFRAALYGSPIVWQISKYDSSDEDAAAEDFEIY
jgi:hypothetical protein